MSSSNDTLNQMVTEVRSLTHIGRQTLDLFQKFSIHIEEYSNVWLEHFSIERLSLSTSTLVGSFQVHRNVLISNSFKYLTEKNFEFEHGK